MLLGDQRLPRTCFPRSLQTPTSSRQPSRLLSVSFFRVSAGSNGLHGAPRTPGFLPCRRLSFKANSLAGESHSVGRRRVPGSADRRQTAALAGKFTIAEQYYSKIHFSSRLSPRLAVFSVSSYRSRDVVTIHRRLSFSCQYRLLPCLVVRRGPFLLAISGKEQETSRSVLARKLIGVLASRAKLFFVRQ